MTLHQTLFLPASSRKFKDFGFMQAYLSFKPDLSEERHSFGSIITIDDAILKPGAKGFGPHSHQDVEVVTFVVQGGVKHIDPNNPLHSGTLSAKGIQVITAGTGIIHNEENNSADNELHALQIWFKPRENGITPNYDKKSLKVSDYTNQLTCILSPNGENDSLIVQQQAFIYYCLSNTNKTLNFEPHGESRRVFIYVIEGEVLINDLALTKGDGYGILDCENVDLNILPDTELLLFDMGG
jgi:redox-sensitive bicupin YhaK (pirin superfamily)